MYFLLPGKNPILSKLELKWLFNDLKIEKYKNYRIINKNIYPYIQNFPLAWFLKYGKIITKNDLEKLSYNLPIKLIATNNLILAKQLKQQGFVKNFKILHSIYQSILEVKNKGTEILDFGKNTYWITQRYQPINIYETIDFKKPIRWMTKGMMPAKLTHLLINLWIWLIKEKNNIFIYDPFVWFWTTGFITNWLWFNFIWSDINPTPAKQNLKRRKQTPYYKKEKIIEIFKHDVKNPFKKSFLKKVNLIVTEWYLWPVIKNYHMLKNTSLLIKQVLPIYQSFFINIDKFWDNIKAVITIPDYISNETIYSIKPSNIRLNVLNEIYKRKNQFVGRKIIILEK